MKQQFTTKTKHSVVLNHLNKYGMISMEEAFKQYKVRNLPGSIYRLRQEGYKISTIDHVTPSYYVLTDVKISVKKKVKRHLHNAIFNILSLFI